jgi:hypothetical protein
MKPKNSKAHEAVKKNLREFCSWVWKTWPNYKINKEINIPTKEPESDGHPGLDWVDAFSDLVEVDWLDKNGSDKETEFLNVLTRGGTNIPLSYNQLVDMWFTKSTIADDLGVIVGDEDLDKARELARVADEERINQTGEYTLREIGDVFGLTGTSIKNDIDSASKKFSSFFPNGPREEPDWDRWEECYETAERIFLEAVKTEVAHAKANPVEGEIVFSPLDLLDNLRERGFTIQEDVSNNELTVIYLVMEEYSLGNIEKVKKILLGDLSSDSNILMSFQNVFSSICFPANKRGRPRKTT